MAILLYLTELYITYRFPIASSVIYSEIRQHFSNSVWHIRCISRRTICCMCVNAAPRMRPLATKVGLELNKYLLLPEASQLWGLSPGLKHYGGPEQFTIVNVQVTPTRLWWWARCWLTAVTPTWSAGSTRTARGSRSTRSCTERYR